MRKTGFLAAVGVVAVTFVLGTSGAQAISSSPTFRGGPVLSGYNTDEVIWSHGGKTASSTVTEGLASFLSDVADASGTTENVFAMIPQYSTRGLQAGGKEGDQIAAYRSTYLGSSEVAPSTGASVTQSEIEAELSSAITEGRLPVPSIDANGEPETVYTVVLPANMEVCVETSNCSGPGNGSSTFCSLRGVAKYNSTAYAFITMLDFSGVLGGGSCGGSSTQLQAETSILTQELGETITDPFIVEENFGWMNSGGLGIGYLCNGQNATDMINGDTWTVQKLWSNADDECVGSDGLFHPPTASFTAKPTENQATFSGSGSSSNHTANVAAGIASYSWDFGDGQSGTGQNPTHAYAAAGTYTVEMTATDTLGFTAPATNEVAVTAPPPAKTGGGSTGGGSTSGSGSTSTPSSSGGAQPSGGTKLATVSVAGSASAVTGGSGAVISGETVQCPQEGGLCVVTVQATTESAHASNTKRHAAKSHKFVVGSATLTVTPGASAKIAFKLNATGKRLLRSSGHLLVKLTVTIQHGSDAAVVATHTLRISATKRHGPK